jgi:mannosylglycerate hydrolase
VLSLESDGDVGDTYTYAAPPGDRAARAPRAMVVRALAGGPLVAALELRWELKAGRGSSLGRGTVAARLVLTLFSGSPVLRCTLDLHNRARDHRLRARVRSGIAGVTATAGAQFGVVVRAPLRAPAGQYRRETPVSAAPAHKFVACGVKNRGMAVLAPGFFEYELEQNGDFLLTLLRAVGQLSRADLATRPGHAGWPVATPGAQCVGRDRLQFALAPVNQNDIDRGTVLPWVWEDVFVPIRAVWLRQASPLAVPSVDVRLEGEGLVFSTLKPAERGAALVLRCYNATAQPAGGVWHLWAPVAAAQRARADEHVLHEIRLAEGSRSVPFHAGPHEIVTIVVTLVPPN